jgi:AraC family transcriptional regulator of adaptative response/methylated-DNA-[protein]-cysteine methyltransferase
MLAVASAKGICLLEFATRRTRPATRLEAPVVPGTNAHIERLRRELDAYFRGTVRRFETPLDLRGTPFQRAVWRRLARVPYGATTTYRELASRIGRSSAVRAVGHANGRNPVSIVVPCHRVIGTDGTLHGYGGGLWRKRRLLDLERAARRRDFEQGLSSAGSLPRPPMRSLRARRSGP